MVVRGHEVLPPPPGHLAGPLVGRPELDLELGTGGLPQVIRDGLDPGPVDPGRGNHQQVIHVASCPEPAKVVQDDFRLPGAHGHR
jgi:hypothetical protein